MLAWVLTNGSADAEARCLGVAEAVADRVERRRVAPRAPWSWLAPFGPVDPRDTPELSSSGPIAPRGGWPDVVVAAGRVAIPYLAHVRRASRGRSLTVFLGDSVAGAGIADVVATLDGGRMRGPNVIVSATGPHRVGAVRLAAARGGPAPVAATGAPRIAVLLGGGAKRRRWGREDVERFAAGLARLRADGAVLMAASRRDACDRLDLAAAEAAHYLWDRTGSDPHVALLAHADALVVAGDDLLLIDEAAATGKPVFAFRPVGLKGAAAAHLDRLSRMGVVRSFPGRLEPYAYQALDSTPEIARAISALSATREALRPRAERRAPARKRETNGPTTR